MHCSLKNKDVKLTKIKSRVNKGLILRLCNARLCKHTHDNECLCKRLMKTRYINSKTLGKFNPRVFLLSQSF